MTATLDGVGDKARRSERRWCGRDDWYRLRGRQRWSRCQPAQTLAHLAHSEGTDGADDGTEDVDCRLLAAKETGIKFIQVHGLTEHFHTGHGRPAARRIQCSAVQRVWSW